MDKLNIYRAQLVDAPIIQSVLEKAPRYQENIQGTDLDSDAGLSVLKELPPNCTQDLKHVLIVEKNDQVIGVVDIVKGYPESEVAYIGLLLLIEKFQGKGMGSLVYDKVEKYIRSLGGISRLRLSYVKNNSVESFWKKMGFHVTGEKRPYESGSIKSLSILMEKIL